MFGGGLVIFQKKIIFSSSSDNEQNIFGFFVEKNYERLSKLHFASSLDEFLGILIFEKIIFSYHIGKINVKFSASSRKLWAGFSKLVSICQ